jgi:hypothetical protein
MAERNIQKVVTRVRMSQRRTDFAYWQAQSYQARLEALEQIRQEYQQWVDDAQFGLSPEQDRPVGHALWS